MKAHYTKAVIALLEAGQPIDQVLSGLVRTLATHNHSKLFGSILRAAARTMSAGSAHESTVTIAKDADHETLKAVITKALAQLHATTQPVIVVDPTIIGGYIVEANNQRIDASYKKSLVSLYQNLTT